tara:strand:- start:617 stop:823 length:207 start_codon:yes stop_codon:yes gene_type:complete
MSELEKLEKQLNVLKQKNKKLQDEVDSLWAMMDEMTKADIENWKHLMKDLEKDTIVKALMVSKVKAEA